MDKWGSAVEVERRNRIMALLAAYAYEFENAPIMADAEFDALCQKIDVSVETGKHDAWFREHFESFTGSWVHQFPDRAGLKALYARHKKYTKPKKRNSIMEMM